MKTKKGTVKVISLSIVLVLILTLKWYSLSSPELTKNFSHIVNSEIKYTQTVREVGKVIWGKIKTVFAENVEKEEAVSGEKSEKLDTEAKEKTEAIELLSFDMGGEESFDDTTATAFLDLYPQKIKHQVPIKGRITSAFGRRIHPLTKKKSMHTGLDIAAAVGTEVLCYADGVVVDAGTDKIYGNFVRVNHANNVQTFYGHNSKLLVKKGQKVTCGMPIALVGSTGWSTGPHLHFEILINGKRQNPINYITP